MKKPDDHIVPTDPLDAMEKSGNDNDDEGPQMIPWLDPYEQDALARREKQSREQKEKSKAMDKRIKRDQDRGPEIFPPDELTMASRDDLADDTAKKKQPSGSGTDKSAWVYEGHDFASFPPEYETGTLTNPVAVPDLIRASRPPGVQHMSTILPDRAGRLVDQQRESTDLVKATPISMAPAAVEVIPPTPTRQPKFWGRKIVWVGVFTFLVVTVIIVVVAVILARPDSPGSDPTPTPIEPYLLMALTPVLSNSSQADISKEGTPQSLAFKSLSAIPGVENFPEDYIQQYYALATLFYATNGKGWTNSSGWLQNQDPCSWYSSSSADICNAGMLTILDLPMNKLVGKLPSDLSILSNLTFLDLTGNELTGPVPSFIGEMTNLEHLNLWRNSFTGPIPLSIGQLSNLDFLDLAVNELTGSIPTTLNKLTRLGNLTIFNNELEGSIPTFIGQLTRLVTLFLSDNKLTGPIPSSLNQLTMLEKLTLFQTAVTGSVPSEICSFENLMFVEVDCVNVTCSCDKCRCHEGRR